MSESSHPAIVLAVVLVAIAGFMVIQSDLGIPGTSQQSRMQDLKIPPHPALIAQEHQAQPAPATAPIGVTGSSP